MTTTKCAKKIKKLPLYFMAPLFSTILNLFVGNKRCSLHDEFKFNRCTINLDRRLCSVTILLYKCLPKQLRKYR